jgi:hypothetical protein
MMTVPVRYILLNEERCRSDPRMVRGEPAQKGMSRKNNVPANAEAWSILSGLILFPSGLSR